MATNKALIEKRKELKRRLETGEYKTLVDVLLDSTSRMIQRLTRNKSRISPWISSMLLYLVVLLVGFIILILIGGGIESISNSPIVTISIFFVNLALGYISIPAIVVGNFYIHHVFNTFHKRVLDNFENINDIIDFENWLNDVCNKRLHSLTSVVVGIPVGMLLISTYADIGINPMTIGVTVLLLSVSNIVFLYLLFSTVLLSARVGRYELALFRVNPADSEVIINLTSLLNKFVFLVALYASYLALILVLSGYLVTNAVMIFVVILFWIPIVALFFLNQNSLSNIIKRAKTKTMNDIQEKVDKLHVSKKLGEKETMETISRFMDYHDRIKHSSSSTIDLRGIINLMNSLLLPLLALLLANLDQLLALFR